MSTIVKFAASGVAGSADGLCLMGRAFSSAVHSLLERDGFQRQRPHPLGRPEPDRRGPDRLHCHGSD